jgi:hypothetical protein
MDINNGPALELDDSSAISIEILHWQIDVRYILNRRMAVLSESSLLGIITVTPRLDDKT